MSKQNKGALSSNNVQEKLSQGLAANKNNNRSRYVASRLPARSGAVGASKATPATPHKNNHEPLTSLAFPSWLCYLKAPIVVVLLRLLLPVWSVPVQVLVPALRF